MADPLTDALKMFIDDWRALARKESWEWQLPERSLVHGVCANQLEDLLLAQVPRDEPRLTFAALDAANRARVVRWHPTGLVDWSALEWAGAMCGEAGEAANAAKKLKRIDGGLKNINTEEGRSLTDRKAAARTVAKEVADTVVYGSLLCAAVDESLEAAIIDVFNAKSEEYGFPERLPAVPRDALPAEPPQPLNWQLLGPTMKMADVRVGMKLRDTHNPYYPLLTVTEITTRGFKYELERPYSLGSRLGTQTGGEHYGLNGQCWYELVGEPEPIYMSSPAVRVGETPPPPERKG